MDERFYTYTVHEIEQDLKTSLKTGLSDSEILERKQKYGKNEIEEKKGKNFFQKFIEQIGDFMILTLLGAAIISFVLGEHSEAILIVTIVVLNAVLGIIQENKAEKSLEAIKKLSSPQARVIREGEIKTIPASEIVVGDIVDLEAGDYVPADLRLFEINGLKIDESALTGESVPVEKHLVMNHKENVSIGDMTNCAFMGTAVTYGSGKGIVLGVGMNTEIGKIAKMINEVDYIQTPIQKNLEHLGKILLIIISIICVIIFLIGTYQRQDLFEVFITVVSLAVAAIPEGLPAIVTIVLALGMQRLVKRNALIRKLPAVETLGSTSVICSDKTGTLTQNKMTVTAVYTNHTLYPQALWPEDKKVKQLAVFASLCNNTHVSLKDGAYQKIGDPTEIALVDLALQADLDPLTTTDNYRRVHEVPFDSDRKRMTTVHKMNKHYVAITKGAPEVIINLCTNVALDQKSVPLSEVHRKKLLQANDQMTSQALRVIAIGYKVLSDPKEEKPERLESDLTFIGLIGMIDPPRPEVYDSIQVCRDAGIQTVMITGDHKNTAIAIAKQLDIIKADSEAISGHELDKLSDDELNKAIENYHVFARVSPEHKVRIVQAWKDKGKIVAMTGDGVNDAPALKRADIGIAMGIQGTEVAKGASDMVLTDDNFATIVKAVEEGRTIFTNIKKSIRFLISCNIGEVVTILLGSLLGQLLYGLAVSPLTAVQLLWANLVTDSLIAIAIGLEKAEPDVMKRKTEKNTLLDWETGLVVFFQGILIGFLSFTAFHIGYRMGTNPKESLLIAQTMAFMTLTVSELFHAFNIRSERFSIFKIGIFTNKYIIYAFIISLLLQIGTLFFGVTRTLFDITWLNVNQFLIILGLSIVPVVVVEIGKLFSKDKKMVKKEVHHPIVIQQ